MVFEPIAPQFEKTPWRRCWRQSRRDSNFRRRIKKAIQMFGRDEFRPIIDGLTIGLQVLLTFIGTLTLGIGGVGVMNIMLVSVDERIREIGLRRALGAQNSTYQTAVPGRDAADHAPRRGDWRTAFLRHSGGGRHTPSDGAAI